jgi:formate hydrogenlyase transcriptional activator
MPWQGLSVFEGQAFLPNGRNMGTLLSAITNPIAALATEPNTNRHFEHNRPSESVPAADVFKFRIKTGLQELLHRLRTVIGADVVGLYLRSEADQYQCCAYEACTKELSDCLHLAVNDGIARRIAAVSGTVALDGNSQLVVGSFPKHKFESGLAARLCEGERVVGLLYVGAVAQGRFDDQDVFLMKLAADRIAAAFDCASVHECYKEAQTELAAKNARLRMLLDINNSLVSKLDIRELFAGISESLRQLTHHRYSQIVLLDRKSNRLRVAAIDFPNGTGLIHEGLDVCVEGSPAGVVYSSRKPLLITHLERDAFPSDVTDRLLAEGVRSICLAPLLRHGRALGVISIGRAEGPVFTTLDLGLLTEVADQVAIAIDNALAFEHIAELNSRLTKEKQFLEEELRLDCSSNELVGTSETVSEVMRQVQIVAPTYATVLIVGETGTGKDLIARAVHRLSSRPEGPFVKLNCASIPATLLESELFGHAKGAYTGAVSRQTGRLEMADGGTLFLDEIGELPLELQPKLLRVLQDRQFERLGESKTVNVNLRLVAATNRNLAEMVRNGQFRSDLYYRLNVFPVAVPALRERKEDIPALVRHFTAKFSRQLQKSVRTISDAAIKTLMSWHWPGNIRELENLIERAVILSHGSELEIPPIDFSFAPCGAEDSSLSSAERTHIIRVLEESGGLIATPRGAAARLGLKRTTLYAKMRKLGISRDSLKQTGAQ